MNTLSTLTERFGTEVLDHLDDAEVHALAGMQRQGDVLIAPATPGDLGQFRDVPLKGIVVVRGESGGNTHRLLADGPVLYRATSHAQVLAEVSVPQGATAYLAHPEHGYLGIAPGHFTIRRQREQADQIRLVAD